MTDKKKVEGCVSAAGGPVAPASRPHPAEADPSTQQEETKMHVSVGKEAPDFEAGAFVNGGFKNIKLSDYRGRWVFLCFYPGDFTFV